MKNQHRLFSKALLMFSLAAFSANAQDTKAKEKKRYEFWKERSVSQSYNVDRDDKLSISNQFGTVNIKTWAKNEVKVDIHIETSSTVKEANDEMFDRIEIKQGKDGNVVSFKTEMDKNENKSSRHRGNQSNNIQVDYDVWMPASLALDLKHRFGKATIPDLTGKVNIDQQFGELVAGKLSNSGKIDVRFSKASFEGLRDAKVELHFANAPVLIKNATGDLSLKVQHSKNGVTVFADDLTSLDIDAQFSDIGVVLPKNASASFDVKTHFGSFTNNSSFSVKGDDDENNEKRRYGPRFDSRYKGSAGSGKVKVNLDGNFSDFILGHEAPVFKTKSSKEKTGQAGRVRVGTI
jgi:hypothetical protein